MNRFSVYANAILFGANAYFWYANGNEWNAFAAGICLMATLYNIDKTLP